VNEIPPPSVSGVIVPAPEELEIIKAGVVEFRLIAKQEIEEWAGKGSELAIAVRDYDRAVERFLWARDLNVANALAMWRETVRYRDTQKLDTLLDKPSPEVLLPFFSPCNNKCVGREDQGRVSGSLPWLRQAGQAPLHRGHGLTRPACTHGGHRYRWHDDLPLEYAPLSSFSHSSLSPLFHISLLLFLLNKENDRRKKEKDKDNVRD